MFQERDQTIFDFNLPFHNRVRLSLQLVAAPHITDHKGISPDRRSCQGDILNSLHWLSVLVLLCKRDYFDIPTRQREQLSGLILTWRAHPLIHLTNLR